MSPYEIISISHFRELQHQYPALQVVDIRDPESYARGHIQGAIRLGNDNLAQFINGADFDQPLVVVCYHGISSQPAAEYLHQQGFERVYSLEGGFAAWPEQ